MYRIAFLLLTIYVRTLTSIVYPVSSVCGVLIAIAVPIDLPNYNVFMSYNFEANYNSPQKATDYSQGPLLFRVQRDNQRESQRNETNSEGSAKNETTSRPAFEPLITRRRIYQWIEDKLKVNGYNGHECLLRAICEHVDSSFSKRNGFLGDLAHIVLSPHTSEKEPNMEDYYVAEIRGESRDCGEYVRTCNTNILDFISKII